MPKTATNQYDPDYVSPPGETLAEILQDRQMPQRKFAQRIGRTEKYVNEVVKGKAPITPRAALEFERVLGIPCSFWNNRQRHYDTQMARCREAEELSEKREWARAFPYLEMSKRGWVDRTGNKLERAKNLLNFFGVANPDAWTTISDQTKKAYSYRKSEARGVDQYALAAWLRKGELVAQEIECQPYDREEFKGCLNDLRRLTTAPPSIFQPQLNSACANCGVAVVFVKELPKTPSGATRWLSEKKALIQLSLRYKTDDHFWFSFFHEAAHILNHQKKRIFLEGGTDRSEEEREANQIAADLLIPPQELESFLRSQPSGRISRHAIKSFAKKLGIAPGIVVGRLQHEGKIPFRNCNDLKEHFEWAD